MCFPRNRLDAHIIRRGNSKGNGGTLYRIAGIKALRGCAIGLNSDLNQGLAGHDNGIGPAGIVIGSQQDGVGSSAGSGLETLAVRTEAGDGDVGAAEYTEGRHDLGRLNIGDFIRFGEITGTRSASQKHAERPFEVSHLGFSAF